MRHHHWQQYFGRHHGGRGTGRFGQGFADDGDLGGRGFGRGRKLGSPDLQLLILGLLADKPRHGYEIIKALEERSKGFYTPSPGMVYPALTYLEEIGHATVEADGSRKLYQITAAGKTHLDENRATVESLFAQFGKIGERMDKVRRAFFAEDQEDPRQERGSEELLQARRALKMAIVATAQQPLEEQKRVAEILKRAATEILTKPERN